jgi:hypothetical protein
MPKRLSLLIDGNTREGPQLMQDVSTACGVVSPVILDRDN